MTIARTGALTGLWGRAFGKDYSDTTRSTTLGDSRSNGLFGGMQMGIDLYGSQNTHVGVFGAKVWSGTTDFVTAPFFANAGITRSNGWVAGGYATFYAPGFYVDAVVQGGWHDHRANANDGTSFATKSQSTQASLELGTAFGSSWKIEPQVQLIYSHTSVDSFLDSTGTAGAIADDDSVIGRAGFRLKRTWDTNPSNAGGLFSFYGKANLWNAFSGAKSTVFYGTSTPQLIEFKQTWADVGLGTTFSVGTGAEFFADADVEFGIDQPATALSGRAGFRIRW